MSFFSLILNISYIYFTIFPNYICVLFFSLRKKMVGRSYLIFYVQVIYSLILTLQILFQNNNNLRGHMFSMIYIFYIFLQKNLFCQIELLKVPNFQTIFYFNMTITIYLKKYLSYVCTTGPSSFFIRNTKVLVIIFSLIIKIIPYSKFCFIFSQSLLVYRNIFGIETILLNVLLTRHFKKNIVLLHYVH